MSSNVKPPKRKLAPTHENPPAKRPRPNELQTSSLPIGQSAMEPFTLSYPNAQFVQLNNNSGANQPSLNTSGGMHTALTLGNYFQQRPQNFKFPTPQQTFHNAQTGLSSLNLTKASQVQQPQRHSQPPPPPHPPRRSQTNTPMLPPPPSLPIKQEPPQLPPPTTTTTTTPGGHTPIPILSQPHMDPMSAKKHGEERAKHRNDFHDSTPWLADHFKKGLIPYDPSCFEWSDELEGVICNICKRAGSRSVFATKGSKENNKRALIQHLKRDSHKEAMKQLSMDTTPVTPLTATLPTPTTSSNKPQQPINFTSFESIIPSQETRYMPLFLQHATGTTQGLPAAQGFYPPPPVAIRFLGNLLNNNNNNADLTTSNKKKGGDESSTDDDDESQSSSDNSTGKNKTNLFCAISHPARFIHLFFPFVT